MGSTISPFWTKWAPWLERHGYRVRHRFCTYQDLAAELQREEPTAKVSASMVYQRFFHLRNMPGHTPLSREAAWKIHAKTTGATAPAPPPLKEAPADPVKAEMERVERMRNVLAERSALREVAGERSFRSFLTELCKGTAPALSPPPPYKPPRVSKGATQETMIQEFSDWHAYEVVTAERTRGFNAYNAQIMGQRVRQVVQTHLSIKQRMEGGGGWNFRRLVVGLNGDFMSGTIHEVERHGDAPNVVLAAYGTALVLAQALRDLAAQYELVECFCSSGNHGRLPDAKRMQQKDPLRSWDALIYLLAKEHLRDIKHLRFFIPDSYSVAFEVEGWRFLQTHGHDIKSWNSIPFYGINRMMANLNALEASRGTPFHAALLGHFHNLSSMEAASAEYFVNGSLIGGTEFSVQGMGRSDKPRQWMLGVHAEHGITHRWPILGTCTPDAPGYAVTPWKNLAA